MFFDVGDILKSVTWLENYSISDIFQGGVCIYMCVCVCG